MANYVHSGSYESAAWQAFLGVYIAVIIMCVFMTRSRQQWTRPGSRGIFRSIYVFVFGTEHEMSETLSSMTLLVETIKNVAVFLMTISPDTLMTYVCGLHPDIMLPGNFETNTDTRQIPCKDSVYGDIFDAFVKVNNMTDSAIETLEDLSSLLCTLNISVYFAIMLSFEGVTMIYFVLRKRWLFRDARINSLIFFLSSLLWGIWPILFRIKYGNGFYCIVRFAPLITLVVSGFHLIIAVILWMVHLVRSETLVRTVSTVMSQQHRSNLAGYPDRLPDSTGLDDVWEEKAGSVVIDMDSISSKADSDDGGVGDAPTHQHVIVTETTLSETFA